MSPNCKNKSDLFFFLGGGGSSNSNSKLTELLHTTNRHENVWKQAQQFSWEKVLTFFVTLRNYRDLQVTKHFLGVHDLMVNKETNLLHVPSPNSGNLNNNSNNVHIYSTNS